MLPSRADFAFQPPGDHDRPALWLCWRPADTAARGAVVFVHGFGDHCGRYEHVFAALSANGWPCLGVDYRGWGKAGGRRGHVTRFADYLDDVEAAVDECRRRAGCPPVLLGQSQGGLVAAAFAIERRATLRGLALVSPAFAFRVHIPAWKRWLARGLSRLWPTLTLPAGIDQDQLVHDAATLLALRQDPLIVRSATARWYTESLAAQARTLAAAATATVPLLLLAAGDDRIVDLAAERAFFAACGAADKVMHEYPDAFHELLQEAPPVRTPAIADLLAWLDRLPEA